MTKSEEEIYSLLKPNLNEMTNAEAVERLKMVFCEECKDKTCYMCALAVALQALNRQIPKKIIIYREHPNYGSIYHCPICESDLIRVEFMRDDGKEVEPKHTYCWKCGNKLDWSVEDDK